jgi:ABC-2 type transport system permease protein
VNALRNIGALVEKEWRHYFGSPIAYVALTMWTLLFGFFYYAIFTMFLEASARSVGQEMGPKLSLNEIVISTVLHNMAVVSLFILPMLTMRLVAEEKRQGTIELLATSPITDLQMILGKFLGALSFYMLMILAGYINFALLWFFAVTKPEWRPLATGSLALLLMGGSFVALGLFLSTLTRNQIIAGILGFGLGLLFWILNWLDRPTADAFTKFIAQLSITNHMEDLMKGVVPLKDIVFYLSFIAYGLFLAHQSVESQRWRA